MAVWMFSSVRRKSAAQVQQTSDADAQATGTELAPIVEGRSSYSAEAQQAARIEDDLGRLEGLIAVKYGLGVPILGDPLHYMLVLATLLFTSLGFGFVISLASQTDSQAVQYAMILLLAGVFFSGFFVALYLLWEPVRLISWMLPVTYGMLLLQQVMLLGDTPDVRLLGDLALMGILSFLLAWWMLRRLMARR